ncbi:MAG: hypothetical protein ACOCRO_07815 [Halanaerobiales bacterium]
MFIPRRWKNSEGNNINTEKNNHKDLSKLMRELRQNKSESKKKNSKNYKSKNKHK